MEIRVFSTDDGALVVVPADATIPEKLFRLDALHPVGEGRVCTQSLSPEVASLLALGGPAMAQPPDVEHLLEAVNARAIA